MCIDWAVGHCIQIFQQAYELAELFITALGMGLEVDAQVFHNLLWELLRGLGRTN